MTDFRLFANNLLFRMFDTIQYNTSMQFDSIRDNTVPQHLSPGTMREQIAKLLDSEDVPWFIQLVMAEYGMHAVQYRTDPL